MCFGIAAEHFWMFSCTGVAGEGLSYLRIRKFRVGSVQQQSHSVQVFVETGILGRARDDGASRLRVGQSTLDQVVRRRQETNEVGLLVLPQLAERGAGVG